MKDEIKEILDRFAYVKKEPYKLSYYPEDLLNREDMWLLYDHITNLEQYYNDNINKYEELLVKYSNLQEEIERLNNIINEIEKVLDNDINNYNGNIDDEEETLRGEFLRGIAFEADDIKKRLKALKEGE